MSQHLPTWKSLLDEADLFEGNHKFFRELLPHSSPLFQLPTGALYWDELTRAQNNVLAGTATPADAMKDVAARVQPQLDRACRK
jgi:multiple sugar transport system substrate-binding protein